LCLFSGDTRANENMGLTSFHALFIRLHNRLALSMSRLNPFWSDDIIYHEVRRIVSAIVQHITYNEFLPLLIGPTHSNFGIYKYNPSVNDEFQI
jgi:peroxidase